MKSFGGKFRVSRERLPDFAASAAPHCRFLTKCNGVALAAVVGCGPPGFNHPAISTKAHYEHLPSLECLAAPRGKLCPLRDEYLMMCELML